MDRFKIGIVGADSPQGGQLIKLLLSHPVAELVAVSSRSGETQSVSEVFPSLLGLCDLSFIPVARTLELADVIFNADPYADSQELAALSIKSKCVFLDMGLPFRVSSEDEYRAWFGTGFVYPGLHDAAIYGLPELLRDHMLGKVLVGVPGPAATASLLALVPLLNEGLVSVEGIVIDARVPESGQHSPFASGQSHETPEIEQILSEAAGRIVRATVSVSSAPSRRGLTVTCYAKATLSASTRTLSSALESYYSEERFVRVLPAGSGTPALEGVIGSNMCLLSARFDERTGTAVVCASLDSLMKGSAGQAIQCMNRVLSMPEDIGLGQMPLD